MHTTLINILLPLSIPKSTFYPLSTLTTSPSTLTTKTLIPITIFFHNVHFPFSLSFSSILTYPILSFPNLRLIFLSTPKPVYSLFLTQFYNLA